MSFLQKLFASPAAMLRISIGLCYIALGGYLLVKNDLLYFISLSFRPVLAVVFIAYGAFRIYRAVKDLPYE
jgi:hypothetical protein